MDDKKYEARLITYKQPVLLRMAVDVFNAHIRHRDRDEVCISCGASWASIWDAGHYYKAEIYRSVKFNEHNVNKQCRKCNHYMDGNEANYRVGLERKIGREAVEQLDFKVAWEKRSGTNKIIDRWLLIDIIIKYRR